MVWAKYSLLKSVDSLGQVGALIVGPDVRDNGPGQIKNNSKVCIKAILGMWVVVKIMVPFLVLSIIRQLVLPGSNREP